MSELVRPANRLLTFSRTFAIAEKMKPKTNTNLLPRLATSNVSREITGSSRKQLMNAPLRYNYPPPVSLETPVDVTELAESVASRNGGGWDWVNNQ